MTTRVIVKKEDLLPVSFDEDAERYVCDGFVSYTETDPEVLRRRGLRLISISEEMKKREAEEKAKAHGDWIVNTILPMARLLHNTHTDSNTSVELWKEHYFAANFVTLRWVKTAEAFHKHLNPEDADK